MTAAAPQRGLYQSIQAGRAVAAPLVVFFYLAANLAKDKYFGADAAWIERISHFGGSAGVAFFFVLSGFIIALMHRRDIGVPERLGTYLRKRAVRIYPTYWVIFAGVYLLALSVPTLRDGMPNDAVVLLKSLLLVPQDPAVVGGTGAPVIVVAWSLQYEIVFYAVMALGIWRRWALLAVLGLFVLHMAWHWASGVPSFPGSFFANEMMLLFGMGAVSARVVGGDWRMRRPGAVAVVAALLFFAVGAASNVYRDALPAPWLHLGYGLTAAVLIVALVQAEQQEPKRFANRFVSLLGDASYAMYLIHFPLIAVLCKLAVAVGLRGTGGVAIAFVGIALGCVVASLLFHLWVERPLLRMMSPRKPPKPQGVKALPEQTTADATRH